MLNTFSKTRLIANSILQPDRPWQEAGDSLSRSLPLAVLYCPFRKSELAAFSPFSIAWALLCEPKSAKMIFQREWKADQED
jgi:hypothetical protein